MHLPSTISCALTVLYSAVVSASSKCGDIAVDSAACDATCVHRMLYYTAFSSASTGFKQAIDAYDAYEWCTSEENAAWCPETLSQTVSAIAGQSIKSISVDFEQCDEQCLLTSLATVSQQSALSALQWAETLFGDVENLRPDEHKIKQLQETTSDLGQQGRADIDSCDLQKAMDDDQPSGHSRDDDDHNKDLAIGLPFLAAPSLLLGPLADDKVCTMDPVLCSGPTLNYLRGLVNGVKKLLPKADWLRSIVEGEATRWHDPLLSSLSEESLGDLEEPEWYRPNPANNPKPKYPKISKGPPRYPKNPVYRPDEDLYDIPEEDEIVDDPVSGHESEQFEGDESEQWPENVNVPDTELGPTPQDSEIDAPPLPDSEYATSPDAPEIDAPALPESEYGPTLRGPEMDGVPLPDSEYGLSPDALEIGAPLLPESEYVPTLQEPETIGPPLPDSEYHPSPNAPEIDAPPAPKMPSTESLYRAEKYNVRTNRLEQQTLREITDEAELSQLPKHPASNIPFKPFEQLDSEGRVIKRVWRTTEGLEPMEGEWVRDAADAGRFVRMESGVQALDSLGEPLMVDAGGAMLTLEPVLSGTGPIGAVAYSAYDAVGNVLPARVPPIGLSPPVIGPPALAPPAFAPLGLAPPGLAPPGLAPPGLSPLDLAPPALGPPVVGSPSVGIPDRPSFQGFPFFGDDDHDSDDSTNYDEKENEEAGESHHSDSHYSPTVVPTTFSTLTRAKTSSHLSSSTVSTSTKAHHHEHVEMASPTSSTLSGPSATSLSDMPQECLVAIDVLKNLDDDDREECDHHIGHLEREESVAWVSSILTPLSCISTTQWEGDDDDIEASPLDELEDTECQSMIKDELTKKEKLTWIGGVMPPQCEYDRDDPDDPDNGLFESDEEEFCEKAAKALVKFVDLD